MKPRIYRVHDFRFGWCWTCTTSRRLDFYRDVVVGYGNTPADAYDCWLQRSRVRPL